MMSCKILLASILVMSFVSGQAFQKVDPKCNSIEISVNKKVTDLGTSIEVDLNGKTLRDFSISIFKPNGRRTIDAETLEFNNLEKGDYVIVVTSKNENGNYCPTHVNVSVE
ncbi:MAG: hypothetical protein RLN86_05990 [Cyclobacteriaceae bacterium]